MASILICGTRLSRFATTPSCSFVNRRTVSTTTLSRRLATSAMNRSSIPNGTIPVVDFGDFLSGSPLHRASIAKQVVEAFKEVGFVYLAQTGVCQGERRRELFDMSKRFFELDMEKKEALAWETPESNRGYVAQGREQVSSSTDPDEIAGQRQSAPDHKETMEIGRDFDAKYQNMWPEESTLPGFKLMMNEFFLECHNLHMEVMRSIALGLNLEERFFDKLCDAQSHNLRLLHYPPLQRSQVSEGGNRAGAHSDYGTVTLLFQDDVGGLQVQDPNSGQFVAATPIPDTVIVNVGDLLARWSNDILKSTLHRVVVPKATTGTDLRTLPRPSDSTPRRQSIAYFSNPNMDTMVDVLPGTGTPKYEPVNAEEYLVRRLRETYM